MKNFLDKQSQSELKNRYTASMDAYWKHDPKMIKCCVGGTAIFVPICDGKYIIPLEKERLEKDFWFGYSDCGQGLSYDENNKRCTNVDRNLVEYFTNRNLEHIDHRIANIKEAIKDYNMHCVDSNWHKVLHGPHYYGMTNEDVAHDYTYVTDFYSHNTDMEVMSLADLKNLLKGLQAVRELTIKRINTYLKRFGTEKIRTNTYWIDR